MHALKVVFTFPKTFKQCHNRESLDFPWTFINSFHFELCALPLLHQFGISVEKLPVIFAVYNLYVD